MNECPTILEKGQECKLSPYSKYQLRTGQIVGPAVTTRVSKCRGYGPTFHCYEAEDTKGHSNCYMARDLIPLG